MAAVVMKTNEDTFKTLCANKFVTTGVLFGHRSSIIFVVGGWLSSKLNSRIYFQKQSSVGVV